VKWKNCGTYLSGIQKFKEEDHDLKKHFKSNFIFPPKLEKPIEEEDDDDKENIKDETKTAETTPQKESEMDLVQEMLEKVKGRQVSHINFDSSLIFDIF
jgi:hypothetical protein